MHRDDYSEDKWVARAESAGLVYIKESEGGFTRRRCGKGFSYRTFDGTIVKSKAIRKRIKDLVIPPAWTDVWICPDPDGHIQATGIDAAGRKQYIYHSLWQEISMIEKYDRLQTMSRMLPRIRRQVRKDLKETGLSKQRVVAAVVRLLDKACIRIGHERYVQAHNSRGATTLTGENIDLDDVTVFLSYEGKSGKQHELKCSDAKLAEVIAQCGEIDSDYLFCYQDEGGDSVSISPSDVNQYLVSATDGAITSKDFRTWKGSVVALSELVGIPENVSQTERKRRIVEAVKMAAEKLGNTNAVCRQSYIHPALLSRAEDGTLQALLKKVEPRLKAHSELSKDEARLSALLPCLDQM